MKLSKEFQKQILETPGVQVGPSTVLPPDVPPPNVKPPACATTTTKPRKRKAIPAPPASLFAGSVHVLWLPSWTPWSLNKLLGHWAERMRRKKRDKEIIQNAVVLHGTPQATRKRKVEVLVVLAKGRKRRDGDNLHKSLLDALVHAGALVNDSNDWCVAERPTYARVVADAVPGTMIVLTDL